MKSSEVYVILSIDNYRYAEPWTTRYMNDTRTLEQLYKEEDEEFRL